MKKHLYNKIISLILSAIILCTFIPAAAIAEGTEGTEGTETLTLPVSGKCNDNIDWTLSEDGVLTLTGTGELHWPHDVFPPVAPWHDYKALITSIVIGEGITNIGGHIFEDCENVKSVYIPNTVTVIKDYAFKGCSGLESVVIPAGVKKIQRAVFEDCSSLKSVILPEGLTTIGVDAFNRCYALKTIELPESLEKLGDSAFRYCIALEKIVIPSATVFLGSVFEGCGALKTAGPIGGGYNYEFPWTDEIPNYAFSGITALREVSLPKSIKKLGFSSFAGCKNLKEIDIHEGITDIGSGAFSGCDSFTRIYLPESLRKIDSSAFSGCDMLEYVYIPKGVEKLSAGAFNYSPKLKTAGPVGGGYDIEYCWTESIPDHAFDTAGLTEIVLPEGLKSIGYGALAWNNFTEIYLPDSIVEVESEALKCCYYLKSVTIPKGLTYVGGYMFFDCNALEEVVFHNNIKSIENYAFASCESLKEIRLPDGLETLGNEAFFGNYALEKVIVPASLKEWGNHAFLGTGIKTAGKIGTDHNLQFCWETEIPEGAFGNAILDLIEIPEGIEKVGLISAKKVIVAESVTHYAGDKGDTKVNEIVFLGDAPENIASGSYNSKGDYLYIYFHCDKQGWDNIEYIFRDNEDIICMPMHSGDETDGDALAPTCEIAGREAGVICADCGRPIDATKAIPPLGHTVVEHEGKPATCTETGLTDWASCSVCNKILKPQEIIPALGHTEEPIPAVPATCLATGLTEGAYCTVCGEVVREQEETPLGEHKIKWVDGKDATCTETGLTYRKYCTVCKEILSEQKETPALGHYEIICSEKKPTCTEKGKTEGLLCQRCGYVFSGYEDIPALGHDEVDIPPITPTCTKDGRRGGTQCTVCGEVTEAPEILPAKGHNTVTKEGQEPTCGQAGYTASSYCADCGEVLVAQESIPATGEHVEATRPGHEPDCDTPGYTESTYCVNCGRIFDRTEIEPLGHDYVEVPEIPPTKTSIGRAAGIYCARCGYVKEGLETIPLGVPLKLSSDKPDGSVESVWIDGVEYTGTVKNGEVSIVLPDENYNTAVTYSYNKSTAARTDVHTVYPTGMKVWMLTYDKTAQAYKMTYVKELDNILQYAGSSIRITGNKGIRMITGVPESVRKTLIEKGVNGYKLMEYGTVVAWESELEGSLTVDSPNRKIAYAYKRGVADPVYKRTNGTVQYTNVLVGFSNDQCKNDLVMRPYMMLRNDAGETIYIYGGEIRRSIGYIAYQNRNAFAPGTASYDYIWGIIHHVYGKQYDADYKG